MPTEPILNKEIKGTFANYECVIMLGCVKLICKIIYDQFLSQKEVFELKLSRINNIANKAKDLDKNLFFFYRTNVCYCKWNAKLNRYKHRITLTPMYCSSSSFLDVGIVNIALPLALCRTEN